MHFRHWYILVMENSCILIGCYIHFEEFYFKSGTSFLNLSDSLKLYSLTKALKKGSLLTLFSDSIGMRLETCWSVMLFTELPST